MSVKVPIKTKSKRRFSKAMDEKPQSDLALLRKLGIQGSFVQRSGNAQSGEIVAFIVPDGKTFFLNTVSLSNLGSTFGAVDLNWTPEPNELEAYGMNGFERTTNHIPLFVLTGNGISEVTADVTDTFAAGGCTVVLTGWLENTEKINTEFARQT